jgi:hypothetical protein
MSNDNYEIDEGTARAFYNYIKDSADSVYKSLDSLNNRLTTLLGFGGLLLRFTIDLPSFGMPRVEDGLKAVIVLSLATTILTASLGLLTYQVPAFYWPDELLDEIEKKNEVSSLTYLALSRKYELEKLDVLRRRRSLILKSTVFLMAIATIGFAINILLGTGILLPDDSIVH